MYVRTEKAIVFSKSRPHTYAFENSKQALLGSRVLCQCSRIEEKYNKKYIQEQEIEDKIQDKRSLKEYKEPFTGK